MPTVSPEDRQNDGGRALARTGKALIGWRRMRVTTVERYGPVAAEDYDYVRDEHFIPEMDGNEQVISYRIIGKRPHDHNPSCRDWRASERGDAECSPKYDVDIEYEVTRRY